MSIHDVLDFALRNHPSLRTKQYEIEAARARLVTAGLWPNPQLVLEAETETSGGHGSELLAYATVTIPPPAPSEGLHGRWRKPP